MNSGMTCGCNDSDQSENADFSDTNALNVPRAAGVSFANSAWYFACARAA